MQVKYLGKYLMLFLKIILLGAITKTAYALTIQDLMPITQHYDTPEQTDYSGNKSHNLQPFEDPHTKLMGYKNKNGEVVIKPKFDMALSFSKFDIADVFLKPNKWYKIDTKGKELYQSYYFDNGADYYVEGLMRFVEHDKVGFADKYGKIVIPASFEYATGFYYNIPVAIVCNGCQKSEKDRCGHSVMVGGKWGMINNKGEVVVPLVFDSYTTLEDHTVIFLKNDYVFPVYLKNK